MIVPIELPGPSSIALAKVDEGLPIMPPSMVPELIKVSILAEKPGVK